MTTPIRTARSLDADGFLLALAFVLVVLGAAFTGAGVQSVGDALGLLACIGLVTGITLVALKTAWRAYLRSSRGLGDHSGVQRP